MTTTPAETTGRLPLSTILPFGLPALPVWAVSIAVFVYLPPYFAGHLGVAMATVGGVFGLVRLIDIPIDVVLAIGMDRTHTRLGRYRLWLMLGGPILMLGLYLLFMAPAHFSAAYLLGALLVMYLGNSMVVIAHAAWAAKLAPHYAERSRLFGVITAVGVVGTLSTLAILIVGERLRRTEAQGVQAMGWFIIGMIPLAVAAAALRAREPIARDLSAARFPLADYWAVIRRPDVLRLFLAQMALTLGPGWMSALYLFFFRSAWGFTTQQATILLGVYILAQVPGALLISALAGRIGKHRALMLATTGFSLGLFSIFVTPKANILAALPVLAWAGLMSAGFNQMINAMLADVGDEVRLAQGRERISLLYATNGLATKIAGALSIGLTFPLLAGLGFNPADGAVNTPAAIGHLEIAFLTGPIVFVMLGGSSVLGWRLTAQRHAEVRAALSARERAAG